jgi:hypothetical protein
VSKKVSLVFLIKKSRKAHKRHLMTRKIDTILLVFKKLRSKWEFLVSKKDRV